MGWQREVVTMDLSIEHVSNSVFLMAHGTLGWGRLCLFLFFSHDAYNILF